MTLLQIDVQATDVAGNIATGTIEVDVNQPPAVSASITPPVVQAAATMHGAGAIQVTADTGQPPAVTGDQGPPQVSQAERSQTLFRSTGGFR